jgi:hypothetical protein
MQIRGTRGKHTVSHSWSEATSCCSPRITASSMYVDPAKEALIQLTFSEASALGQKSRVLGGAGRNENRDFRKGHYREWRAEWFGVRRLLQRYRGPPSVIAHAIVQDVDVPRFDRSASPHAPRAAIRTSPSAKSRNLQVSAISQSGMRSSTIGRLRTTLTPIVHGRF